MIGIVWWALWTPYVGKGALSFLCIFAPAWHIQWIKFPYHPEKKDLNTISKIDKGRE